MYYNYLPIIHGINAASGAYATGTRMQNPGTRTATVRTRLFNHAGQVAVLKGTIPSGLSVTLFPLNVLPPTWSIETAVPGFSLQTFHGSAIVEADQPIATVVNLNSNCGGQPCAMASYSGLDPIVGDIVLPLVQRNNAGASSWLTIQNADTQDAFVTIEFKPRGIGSATTLRDLLVRPGTAIRVDLAAIFALGPTFVGSATVRNRFNFLGIRPPLAVVANHEKHDQVHSLQASNGFEAPLASTQVALPLIMADNAGSFTAPLIFNAGTVATTIQIDYTPNQVVAPTGACAPQRKLISNLAPGVAVSYVTGGNEAGFTGCRYVGAARVTATGAPIVATVRQTTSGASGTSDYEGIALSDAVDTVSLPLIMANNGGFFTGIQIQNVATTAARVTLRYEPNTFTGTNRCAQPPALSFTLPARVSTNVLQAGGFFATCIYVGSATVTSQNVDDSLGRIAVLVNQARLTPNPQQDAVLSYTGLPNP